MRFPVFSIHCSPYNVSSTDFRCYPHALFSCAYLTRTECTYILITLDKWRECRYDTPTSCGAELQTPRYIPFLP